MPKLDLTTAKRIKVASGEVSRLKGVGFEWVKPVTDLRAQVIAALYGAGEQGAMYDPPDLSTLFQDSAGTTPVTADSQPVGRMLDVSGNGNHATQADAARRPLYRDIDSLPRVRFDGLDDSLTVPNAINNTDKSFFFGVGHTPDSANEGQIVAWAGMRFRTRSGSFEFVHRDDNNSPMTVDLGSFTSGQPHVVVMMWDHAAGDLKWSINGGATSSLAIAGGRTNATTCAVQPSALDIFGAAFGPGTKDESQLSLLKGWLASKSGVELS